MGAGVGYGAHPDARESFRAEAETVAASLESDGAAAFATRIAEGPARVQFQNKDPRGWAEFARLLAEHSSEGSANTMRGVQRERPSLYDLRGDLAKMEVPVLLVVGDKDEGCLDANLMLKRTIPSSGLAVLPRTGHASNLEEPELFVGRLGLPGESGCGTLGASRPTIHLNERDGHDRLSHGTAPEDRSMMVRALAMHGYDRGLCCALPVLGRPMIDPDKDDLPPPIEALLEDVFFRKAHWHSAYEVAVQRLAQAIKLGALTVGARLPPERELVERLGVSRTTLREGIGRSSSRDTSGPVADARGNIRRAGRIRQPNKAEIQGPRREMGHLIPGLLDMRAAVEPKAAELAACARPTKRSRTSVGSSAISACPFRSSARPIPRSTSRSPTRRSPTGCWTWCSRSRCGYTTMLAYLPRSPGRGGQGHSVVQHSRVVEAIAAPTRRGRYQAMQEHIDVTNESGRTAEAGSSRGGRPGPFSRSLFVGSRPDRNVRKVETGAAPRAPPRAREPPADRAHRRASSLAVGDRRAPSTQVSPMLAELADQTSACSGSRYGVHSGWSRSKSTKSAFFPASSEPISSSHPSARAPSIVAIRKASLAPRIPASSRASLNSPAVR